MSTDEQLAKTIQDYGLVGGCLLCIVAASVPISLALLLAPITGVSVWKIFLMLVLAKLWFG